MILKKLTAFYDRAEADAADAPRKTVTEYALLVRWNGKVEWTSDRNRAANVGMADVERAQQYHRQNHGAGRLETEILSCRVCGCENVELIRVLVEKGPLKFQTEATPAVISSSRMDKFVAAPLCTSCQGELPKNLSVRREMLAQV